MGIFFNPGNEGFKSVVRSKVYIDKTEMLKYTNSVCDTEQRYLCVSRPRRYGKSITAEMLVAYYDKSCDSREIFQPLKIGKSVDFEEHMNKYDVIHIDVNYFRGQSVNGLETVEKIQKYVTEELKETYLEGIDKEEWKLPVVLAKINKVYGVKFIIVIDEWDAIFREDKSDVKAQEAYITLLRGLFKDAIIEMLAGGKCKVNPQKFQNDMISFKSKDDILTLLIHLGYLAYDMKNGEVSIPNAEVREEYKNAIEDTGWEKVMEAINASEQLLQATWNHDEVAVAKGIDAIHTANTSILSYNNENYYVQTLKGYKGEVLLVGINYDKEKKEHQCVIESIAKL